MANDDTTSDDTTQKKALAEAVRWLQSVDGRLMRRREDVPGPDGWVALVRTPAATGERAQLIIGVGDSLVEAVETARESWQHAFEGLTVH